MMLPIDAIQPAARESKGSSFTIFFTTCPQTRPRHHLSHDLHKHLFNFDGGRRFFSSLQDSSFVVLFEQQHREMEKKNLFVTCTSQSRSLPHAPMPQNRSGGWRKDANGSGSSITHQEAFMVRTMTTMMRRGGRGRRGRRMSIVCDTTLALSSLLLVG